MGEYFVEWRRTVRRVGPPVFVALDNLEGRTGFRGVYGFRKALAEQLTNLGSTANLRDVPVYSDTLFVDYDSQEGAAKFEEMLRLNGMEFEVWSTGRRGVHFHIAQEPELGSSVPARQKTWMETHATGDWDPTIYRPIAVIRLPGTWHEKSPGHRKELLRRFEGGRLELPRYTRVTPEAATPAPKGRHTPTKFWEMVHTPKAEPGRRMRAFALAASGAECGVDEGVVWDAIQWWAQNMCSPRLEVNSELERMWRNGYRRALAKG